MFGSGKARLVAARFVSAVTDRLVSERFAVVGIAKACIGSNGKSGLVQVGIVLDSPGMAVMGRLGKECLGPE
jgi:hypothetical protein